jgi:FMN phosphatase YigB (HAD superfamily)
MSAWNFGKSTPTKIAWDLGDTLIRIKEKKLYEGAMRASINFDFSISKQQIEKAIKAEWSVRKDRRSLGIIRQIDNDAKEIDFWVEDFYPCVLRRIGYQKRISCNLLEYFCGLQMNPENFELMPDAKQVLKILWNEGVEQCILSNAFPSAKRIIAHNNLGKYFNFILLSYEINLVKPDPKIYYLLEEKFRLTSEEEIIFIDDRSEFLVIPNGLKVRPVWLNSHLCQLNDRKTECVQNIKEVLKYFSFKPDVKSSSRQTIWQDCLFT